MRIFDPHIHMTSRTTDDYRRMHAAGVRAVVEPSFWLGQPRTSVGSFTDYFDALLGWEPFRASQYGIAHHATIGLNPKEANDARCREVLDVLPRYLAKDRVVAVGEPGLRLDDARGGRRLRRAGSRWPPSTSARARAHAAPRQGSPGRAAPSTSCASRRSSPAPSSSTTSTR